MHKEYKPIKFPEDESAHDYIAEWWYFNGHLKDRQGNEYAFMDCFFKVDVKIMPTNFLSNIDWSSPTTIGIGIAIIAVIAIGGYLWWVWSEKKPPFNQ